MTVLASVRSQKSPGASVPPQSRGRGDWGALVDGGSLDRTFFAGLGALDVTVRAIGGETICDAEILPLTLGSQFRGNGISDTCCIRVIMAEIFSRDKVKVPSGGIVSLD